MGKFICKDCGYEGDKKNISVFSKIVFFIFILILITFLGVLMQVASQSPGDVTQGDNMEVGGLFFYALFAFIIYKISKKNGCAHCKSKNIIPSNSPLGKKFKEQL